MNQQLHTPPTDRLSWGLRLAGLILTAAPVLLMLVTGLIGSAVSRQPHMDLLLPAELSLLTIPGMILLAVAAVRQRIYPRLSVALPVIAVSALSLCQGLAICSGIAYGLQEPQRPPLALLVALLLLFDLMAVAAPIVGFLSIWRLHCRR